MSDLWNKALDQLRERVAAESFAAWLEPIEFVSWEDDLVCLKVPNRFYADWISAHYLDALLRSLQEQRDVATPVTSAAVAAATAAEHSHLDETSGRQEPARTEPSSRLCVQWQVDEGLQARVRTARHAAVHQKTLPLPTLTSSSPTAEVRPRRPRGEAVALATTASPTSTTAVERSMDLHPKYHFDDFVVGPSNQLAHAASIAVCRDPGKRYNPLFIYGGVGLGKTHLLNAIGHQLMHERPDWAIRYLSAERFTNEFITALRSHQIDAFRQRYRQHCDVLLMDDIQFLAGREQTQEEFFHTFNALYHANRQIVLTSDAGPERISEMQERLISRFQSGMVADTQAPELDTRIAILQKKAEQEKIHLHNDVALYIAQQIRSNVRELEGTLLRLAVKAELARCCLDLEFVTQQLSERRSLAPRSDSFEDIQRAVCDYFQVRLSDLKSSRRARTVTFPRMVAMYLCRHRLNASYPEIGDRFGGKDHTTVIHAVRKIHNLAELDDSTRTALESIGRKLLA